MLLAQIDMNPPDLNNWVWCLIVFLLIVWKLWPDVSSRVKKTFDTARYGADLVDKVEELYTDVYSEGGIKDKLSRDYNRINWLESREKINTEENELIMKSMLAMLKAINKIEPSEDTTNIQDEIIEFMNQKSHKSTESEEKGDKRWNY